MITNGEQSDEADKWHYIALKSVRTDDGFNRPIRSLSRLIRGLTSNNHGDLLFGSFTFNLNKIMHLKIKKDCVIIIIIVM